MKKIDIQKTEARPVFRVDTTVKTNIICPDCGGRVGSIDHLKPPYSFGSLYCDDCGAGWAGKGESLETLVLERGGKYIVKLLVLLKLCHPLASGREVFIVVEDIGFSKTREVDLSEILEHKEFHYNENTCPWNYLRFPLLEVGENGHMDADPHGIFEYVTAVVMPKVDCNGDEFEKGSSFEVQDWLNIFPGRFGYMKDVSEVIVTTAPTGAVIQVKLPNIDNL